jgi:mono/diheme cytochrome c family protein
MNLSARFLHVALVLAAVLAPSSRAAAQNEWTIPGDGAELKSPLSPTEAVVKRGKSAFSSRCQQCHGADGRGHGKASDPDHPAADLTDPVVTSTNTPAILFYKIWNGKKPMPAFKSELTRDEVWAIVEYIKTLREN